MLCSCHQSCDHACDAVATQYVILVLCFPIFSCSSHHNVILCQGVSGSAMCGSRISVIVVMVPDSCASLGQLQCHVLHEALFVTKGPAVHRDRTPPTVFPFWHVSSRWHISSSSVLQAMDVRTIVICSAISIPALHFMSDRFPMSRPLQFLPLTLVIDSAKLTSRRVVFILTCWFVNKLGPSHFSHNFSWHHSNVGNLASTLLLL